MDANQGRQRPFCYSCFSFPGSIRDSTVLGTLSVCSVCFQSRPSVLPRPGRLSKSSHRSPAASPPSPPLFNLCRLVGLSLSSRAWSDMGLMLSQCLRLSKGLLRRPCSPHPMRTKYTDRQANREYIYICTYALLPSHHCPSREYTRGTHCHGLSRSVLPRRRLLGLSPSTLVCALFLFHAISPP